jgi:hypothetical protein
MDFRQFLNLELLLKLVDTFRFLLKSDQNKFVYMKIYVRLWHLVLDDIYNWDGVLCEMHAEAEETTITT